MVLLMLTDDVRESQPFRHIKSLQTSTDVPSDWITDLTEEKNKPMYVRNMSWFRDFCGTTQMPCISCMQPILFIDSFLRHLTTLY